MDATTNVFGIDVPPAGRTVRFIAWSKTPKATPVPGGRTEQVRSQTFVTAYPPMSIREIKMGGRNGNQEGLASLVMDEGSAGFNDPISAPMRTTNNPAFEAAKAAFDAQRPIVLVTETKRRTKTKRSKEPVSPLSPIQALRGAAKSDAFERSDMNTSAENIATVVASVDSSPSSEVSSDPAEWGFLQTNRYGDLAPAGWKFVGTIDPEDERWKDHAVLLRDGAAQAAPQQGGAGVDAQALAAIVSKAVEDTMRKVMTASEGPSASGPSSKPARGRDREPSMYAPRLGDGRVNLGWVGVQNAYWTLSWLRSQAPEGTDEPTLLAMLPHVLAVIDHVQAAAYGHGFTPDRVAKSHEMARRCVQDSIAHDPQERAIPFGEQDVQAAIDQWGGKVGPDAVSLLTALGRITGDFLAGKDSRQGQQQVAPPPTQQPQRSASSAHSPAQAPTSQVTEEGRAALEAVAAAWDDVNALAATWSPCKTAGLLDTPVVIRQTPDGKTVVAPNADGEHLGVVIRDRGTYLRRVAEQAPAPAPAAQGDPADEEPVAPEQAGQGALDVPGAPDAGPTGSMGYPTDLDALAAQVNAATGDEDALHDAYTAAREKALLQAQVRFDGKAVTTASTGFAQVTLADVITDMLASATPGKRDAADVARSALEAGAPQEAPTSESGPSTPEEYLAAAKAAETADECRALYTQAVQAGLGDAKVRLNGAEGLLKQALTYVGRQKNA